MKDENRENNGTGEQPSKQSDKLPTSGMVIQKYLEANPADRGLVWIESDVHGLIDMALAHAQPIISKLEQQVEDEREKVKKLEAEAQRARYEFCKVCSTGKMIPIPNTADFLCDHCGHHY